MLTATERIGVLLQEIGEGVYEKDRELRLALLAALAGESILLLGPPGVAKSKIARQLKKAFKGANAFEYLMSRFSTPDEIFGPVSIQKLKNNDCYERNTKGFLPDADVVFLDEIWKAGPAIQNALLTVINERIFRNGDTECKLPLKLLIAASNELPAQGEGLEALWDRFVIRLVCDNIKNEDTFYQMLLADESLEQPTIKHPLSDKEWKDLQAGIQNVEVPADVLHIITAIRGELKSVAIPGTEVKRSIYVSDRRWKKIVALLKASAFIHGRNAVDATDVFLVHHCIWNSPDEIETVRGIVMGTLCTPLALKLKALKKNLTADLKQYQINKAAKQLQLSRYDRELKVANDFYFQLTQHGIGYSYIFMTDFISLSRDHDKPQRGTMYKEKGTKNTIIRTLSDQGERAGQEYQEVMLYRDELFLYINGVRYELERLPFGQTNPDLACESSALSGVDYNARIEELSSASAELERHMKDNLFVSEEDAANIATYLGKLRREIAYTRVDVAKLEDHEDDNDNTEK